MGKNNKARRAAKAKSRARARSHRGSAWSERGRHMGGASGWCADGQPLFTADEQARNLLLLMAQAQGRGGDPSLSEGVRQLVSLPADVVDRAAESVLLGLVGDLWAGGWQPAELRRQGRRGCSTAPGSRLIDAAIATDHAGRRSSTLDGRWVAQVNALGLPAVSGKPGWFRSWAEREGIDRAHEVAAVIDLLANLFRLPVLDPILPPPGSAGPAAAGRSWDGADPAVGGDSDPVLERIRALLAKAESTSFESEAEAFTAKAQELMTRHAVDAAVVSGGSGKHAAQPVAIRLPIDAPYVDAKTLLLQTVAEAGRCRSVFHVKLDLSTVVGAPADVAAVQMLFTSLLLQAQTALGEAARKASAGTRVRSQSYRSAFLLSYADRIGERLRHVNDAVFAEAEAEHGSGFLPVLRSRLAAVDDFIAERFGETVSAPVRRGYDPAGWAGGRVAADNAQLQFGELADQAATRDRRG
jgi:hypothetical protein